MVIYTKILILSYNCFNSVDSVATSLKEACDSNNIDNKILDSLIYIKPKIKKYLIDRYNSVLKRLLKKSYNKQLKNLYEKAVLADPVYSEKEIIVDDLIDYLNSNNFTHVISTHIAGMQIMTEIKKRVDIKCFGVLTDYSYFSFFDKLNLDGYFLPDQDIIDSFKNKGIENVIDTGIPVPENYIDLVGRNAARNFLIVPDKMHFYLLFGYGLPYEYISDICDSICKIDHNNCRIYVVLDRDSFIKDKLEEKYKESQYVYLISYTNKISVYIEAADVVITRPDGIIATESVICNTPIVFTSPFLENEKANVNFFCKKELAIAGLNTKDIADKSVGLLNNLAISQRIHSIQKRFAQFKPANIIIQYLKNFQNKK